MNAREYNELRAKANVLSGAGQERMIKNGWRMVCINSFESDEHTADRLSGFSKVKVYRVTTFVRGIYNYIAMVKR